MKIILGTEFYKVKTLTKCSNIETSKYPMKIYNYYLTNSLLINEGEIDIEAKSKDSDALTYVYFYLDSKNYGKKNLENLKEEVNKKYGDKEVNVIIVLEDKPTAQLNKEINTEDYSNFEIFLVKNLMINITKHVNVPRHEIIKDKEEIDKIVGEYHVHVLNYQDI